LGSLDAKTKTKTIDGDGFLRGALYILPTIRRSFQVDYTRVFHVCSDSAPRGHR
jgi:hypothetical protein